MPTLREFLSSIKKIEHTPSGPVVEKTVARALLSLSPGATIGVSPGLGAPAGTIRVAVVPPSVRPASLHPGLEGNPDR